MGELTERIAPVAPGAAIIEVEDLVKRYRKGKTNAVDGISFSVRSGEFFALLGPNGAGKTTTISILTTTLIPTSGRVRIGGNDVVTQASSVHRPAVLFLDEPTRGLDTNGRRNLWEYLRGVQAAGTTVFLTTHYLEEAEAADSVCIINRGRIVSFGPPSRIKAELVSEHVLIDA